MEQILENTVSWDLILKWFSIDDKHDSILDLNQLVYVDSADQCNDLGFNIGGGASTITRAWTIKVFNLFYNHKDLNDMFCSNL